MPKVYLSPAYHWYNTCAVDGCDETTHNNLYLDELEPFLRACGIAFLRGPRRTPKSSESGTALMIQAVAASNQWGADVHYISHTNASGSDPKHGKARGYRPIIFTGSQEGKRLAQCMIARRRAVYDQSVTLNERADLYELRVPAAVSYYEEHVFHDNPDDAAWFHAHLRDVARAACQGLCDYFALPYKEPYPAAEADGAVDSGSSSDAAPTENGTALAPVLLPVLQRGDKGGTVKALQQLLNGSGHSAGTVDGDFGVKTESAVRRYQLAMALGVTGAADEGVWKKLLGL